jgi:electron transport complex protein RnfC
VERGQLLAEPDGFMSTALHSPVTGWIKALQPQRHPNGRLVPTVCIDTDPFATQQMISKPANQGRSLSFDAFVGHVQQAGLVGMGGAAFPSHVKYAPPPEKPVHHLVINGSECEPYLTADYRLMVERPSAC